MAIVHSHVPLLSTLAINASSPSYAETDTPFFPIEQGAVGKAAFPQQNQPEIITSPLLRYKISSILSPPNVLLMISVEERPPFRCILPNIAGPYPVWLLLPFAA